MAETLAHFAVPLGKAAVEALAPDPIAASRAIFEEQMRQQREILALQREAYQTLIEMTRTEQANLVALLGQLGLTERREHALPQYHGAGHAVGHTAAATAPRDDGFIF